MKQLKCQRKLKKRDNFSFFLHFRLQLFRRERRKYKQLERYLSAILERRQKFAYVPGNTSFWACNWFASHDGKSWLHVTTPTENGAHFRTLQKFPFVVVDSSRISILPFNILVTY